MKKTAIVIFLVLIPFVIFSQNVKLEGVVKDSLGNPLEMANVIAFKKGTTTLQSYSITDPKGNYKLSLEQNQEYTLKISYIGFEAKNINVSIGTTSSKKNVVLKESSESLNAVELTYEMPVTIKGDSLIYNADSFKNGTERKLEDVLEKMPGIEINDDGEIEVEGVRVSKLMVDDKDFFDGDSKLAIKNIPSNVVDKIQVLKNYSEIGQLSGVTNNQDNIAINIKLKKGKSNFWFGDVTAGGGIATENDLYLIQPKLFYYSPKYSINLIGDLNNIGEIAFTRRDYRNFTGGFRSPSRNSGTSINLGNNDLGFLSMQNNRAKDINTKFGAANFSYAPKKTLDLSGFAIFSSSRIALQENNTVHYTSPDLGIPDENTESTTSQKSDLGMFKLSAKYTPNTNKQLDYDFLGRLSKESQIQDFLSSINGSINQLENSKPFSFNQNLNYYYTLNEKNIFALEVQHLIKDEDPFYNALLEDKTNYEGTASGLGLNNFQVAYDISQKKRVKSNQLDAKIDYWSIINNKSDINFTIGYLYSNQKFDSNIFQKLDNGSLFDPTPIVNNGLDNNQIDYSFNDMYLGAHYRFKAGIFTFSPGVSAHIYQTKNNQFGVNYKDDFFRILPDFNTRIQLKRSERITLNYALTTQFTDVSNLAKGLVLNRYNSFLSGNPELENALAHSVNASYFSFNMFNYTNISARISYNKTIDRIRNTSNFVPGSVIRYSSPFNSEFADESASASGRFQRSFGKFRATARGSFNYSKFNQFINNRRSVNENYSQNYRAEFRTNFRNAPNFEIAYRYGIQDNDQGFNRTKFYTNSPSISFDALLFKTLTFKTEYTYTNFSNEDRTINSFQFWDASLAYRKNRDSKWELELKASNLLDTKSQNQSSSSAISVSAREYFIQPRYTTFRIRYNL